jgi:uncharacterized protein YidB (DUF937 family)
MMFPISVTSTNDAVRMGVDNYRYNQDRLANSIGELGKSLEKGILTARLAGGNPSEAALRAAERAGMQTGYIPMSVRDQGEIAQAHDFAKMDRGHEQNLELFGLKQEAAERAAVAKAQEDELKHRREMSKGLKGEDKALLELVNKPEWSDKDRNQFIHAGMTKFAASPGGLQSFINATTDKNKVLDERARTAMNTEIQNVIRRMKQAGKGKDASAIENVLSVAGDNISALIAGAMGVSDESVRNELLTTMLRSGDLFDKALATDYIKSHMRGIDREAFDAEGEYDQAVRGQEPVPAPPVQQEAVPSRFNQLNDAQKAHAAQAARALEAAGYSREEISQMMGM